MPNVIKEQSKLVKYTFCVTSDGVATIIPFKECERPFKGFFLYNRYITFKLVKPEL